LNTPPKPEHRNVGESNPAKPAGSQASGFRRFQGRKALAFSAFDRFNGTVGIVNAKGNPVVVSEVNSSR
jgi:hypothetical protein